MNTLTGDHHRFGAWLRESTGFVGEDSGGIDNGARWDGETLVGFAVDGDDSTDEPVFIFGKFGDAAVVEDCGTVLGCGGDEMDEQAGVVELAVVIHHTATETVLPDRGKQFEGLFEGEGLGGAEAVLAGEKIVDLHADAIERSLPP